MGELARAAVVDACRYFDEWLAFRQRYDRVPGVQAAVLHGADVVLATAHGHADVETGTPLTTAHRFRIASHSKTFTAMAVLQLVDRGALRLDDPASHWVATLRGTPLGAVTVRELLAHGGGVVRDGWHADFWQLADPFPDADTLARIVADDAAVLARNERFKYSNVGYSLLGLVVEAASGRPYAEHVAAEILGPLGLADTSVDIDLGATGGVVTGYTGLGYADARVPVDHVHTAAMASATGFVSTAVDVVRAYAALFPGDGRVLGDDAKRLMQHVEWVGDGIDASYGLGVMIADVGGRRVIGHGGGFPGQITRTMVDPAATLAVSVLTNAIDGPATPYATVAVRLIDLAASGDADPPARAARFRGRFANLWSVFDLVDLGGRLYRIDPVQYPAVDALPLDIVDDGTLHIDGGPAYGAPGERIVVERAADARIVALHGGGGITSYPYDAVRRAVGGLDRIRPGTRLGP